MKIEKGVLFYESNVKSSYMLLWRTLYEKWDTKREYIDENSL